MFPGFQMSKVKIQNMTFAFTQTLIPLNRHQFPFILISSLKSRAKFTQIVAALKNPSSSYSKSSSSEMVKAIVVREIGGPEVKPFDPLFEANLFFFLLILSFSWFFFSF